MKKRKAKILWLWVPLLSLCFATNVWNAESVASEKSTDSTTVFMKPVACQLAASGAAKDSRRKGHFELEKVQKL